MIPPLGNLSIVGQFGWLLQEILHCTENEARAEARRYERRNPNVKFTFHWQPDVVVIQQEGGSK